MWIFLTQLAIKWPISFSLHLMSVNDQLSQKYSYQKLLKSNNPSSSYNRKCSGCFLRHVVCYVIWPGGAIRSETHVRFVDRTTRQWRLLVAYCMYLSAQHCHTLSQWLRLIVTETVWLFDLLLYFFYGAAMALFIHMSKRNKLRLIN